MPRSKFIGSIFKLINIGNQFDLPNVILSKIDTAFYESKIRVNGEKLLKKSKRVRNDSQLNFDLFAKVAFILIKSWKWEMKLT